MDFEQLTSLKHQIAWQVLGSLDELQRVNDIITQWNKRKRERETKVLTVKMISGHERIVTSIG